MVPPFLKVLNRVERPILARVAIGPYMFDVEGVFGLPIHLLGEVLTFPRTHLVECCEAG